MKIAKAAAIFSVIGLTFVAVLNIFQILPNSEALETAERVGGAILVIALSSSVIALIIGGRATPPTQESKNQGPQF